MSLPVFPDKGSIPPATFYTMRGLSDWLNRNPEYKQYFINYPNYFPYLYSQSTINALISTSAEPTSSIYLNYNIQKVPLAPIVTTLSEYQSRRYREQLDLFLRVYTHNSNAYVSSVTTGQFPLYYRFHGTQEHTEYRSGVKLVNKMYPFDALAYGANENGSTMSWIIPFPL